jgi:hypothetical protein
MIDEDLVWLRISITLGMLFITLQKAKCLLISSELIQTSELEKFFTQLEVKMRGPKDLIECIGETILIKAIIRIGNSSKKGHLTVLDKRVVDWV